MAKSLETKNRFLAAMAEHVLDYGLNTASLRPLAKAASTSDRMLIYHFGSKNTLIAELLQYLAGDLMARLDNALPTKQASTNAECLREIVALLRQEPFKSFMALWFDILSAAGQGETDHAQTGHVMMSGFRAWLEARLPASDPTPKETAALMLTLIEGVLVMDKVGHTDISDVAIANLFPS